jgi:uncharacterized SAM-binding protein YcdF (DUF218 family)
VGSSSVGPSPSLRRWVRVAVLVALSALALGLYLVLNPRLDSPQAVEAVVVLGGAEGERFDLGRQLAQTHDASLVLSASAVNDGRRAGLICGRDVTCVEPVPYSTAGEARTIAALAAAEGWDSVAVVTTRYHANRARLLFQQCLDGEILAHGAEPRLGGLTLLSRRLREIPATLHAVTFGRAC